MEYISYGMNLVDCDNTDVYNSQVIIKIKRKNDTQSWMAQTWRKALLPSNLNGLLREISWLYWKFNKGEIDADTSCQIEKQILTDEIQDTELLNFAIENYTELFLYIKDGIINIRICRDITG